ncbi:uncharacterized protein LOC115769306 [Drosophila novamexicana]|uniref:uncharacterized protein LOC115769306 n=1 Tax=Drosophila novamexicana TaxID=47314 RepID=UPI0011E5AF9D|nr:uncharacterized protein LOC115769306 [Drosophila novamexicana]
MRCSYFVLAAVLCCSLCAGRTLFDDELREFTEFLRLQMHCGYPERGIPILAPAQLAYKELDIHTDSLSCKGNFTDLSVVGLDGFEFFQLQWNNIFHTIKFDVSFPSIQLKSAAYKLDLLGRIFGANTSLGCNGRFDLELINLRANGSFVLRPSGLTNGVHITSWNVDWQLGKTISQTTGIGGTQIVTKFINAIIQDFLELLINDNPQEVSQFMEQLIAPPMNTVLENVAWYEITAIILGLVKGVLPLEPIC